MPLIPKTIGIVGSRRRNEPADYALLEEALYKVYKKGDRLVSGGCELGADHFAEQIAKVWGIGITIHYPRRENLDERLLKTNPRGAYAIINFARNTLIARDAKILLALVAPDRKGGTEDTVAKALALGKEVVLL